MSIYELPQDVKQPDRAPSRDRLRARALVCYTTASGNEAEEYLPGRSSASRDQCKPGGQAVGKGAVELRFLSDLLKGYGLRVKYSDIIDLFDEHRRA